MTSEIKLQLLLALIDQDKHSIDLNRRLTETLTRIVKLTKFDRAGITLADSDTGVFSFSILSDGETITPFSLEPGLLQQCSTATSQISLENPSDSIRQANAIPIQLEEQRMGFLYLEISNLKQSTISSDSSSELAFFQSLCNQIALSWVASGRFENRQNDKPLFRVGEAMVSLTHHIKNIFQGVNGGAHILNDGLNHQNLDLVRQGWEIVSRNQTRMADLVTDVLSLDDHRELALRRLDLRLVISAAVQKLQSKDWANSIQFDWLPHQQPQWALFDEVRIFRLLENLLRNAIESCQDRTDGKIVVFVEADVDSKDYRISISDNGSGIPHENLSQVFSLFESSKENRKCGIGLAVSQKYAQQHDGEILVQSEEGQGSCFTVVLPFPDKMSEVTKQFGIVSPPE